MPSKNIALRDQVAWDGPTLIATSEDLLAKIRKPYLSPSTAKALHGCHARLLADKALPREFDPFAANDRGTAAHLVLELLYALPPHERTRERAATIITSLADDPPLKGEVDYRKHVGGDPVTRTRWIEMVTAMVDGLLAIETPADIDVHSREMRLDGVKIAGGVQFKGFIDRIDWLERAGTPTSGRVAIRDYKSGKVPNLRWGDDHGDQIRLYAEAVETATDLEVRGGSLLYIDHKQIVPAALDKRARAKTLAAFASAYETQVALGESGRFTTTPSALCGWCPLVNACPSARPAKSPKDPRATSPSAADLAIPTATPAALAGAASNAPASPQAAQRPAAQPVQQATATSRADAAHMTSSGAPGATDTTGEDDMTSRTRGAREEGKAWEPTVGGQLNLNSYAAMGVVGLSSLAAEMLSERGVKPNPSTLTALTSVLARVTLAAQATVTGGSTDWSEGANTRVRGALRTVCEIVPLPLGADTQAWTTWEERAVRFAVAIVQTGITLFEEGLPADVTPLTTVTPEK